MADISLQIQEDLKTATSANDTLALNALRALKSAPTKIHAMKSARLLLLLSLLQPLVAEEVPTLALLAEVKGFASPESIAWDGSHYYVSNVGKELKPTEKDGDGFISRMDANGDNVDLHFIDKLNAPKGMLVVGNTLYLCDIDLLLGFDLASRKKVLEISFAKDGVQFLNDVCSAGDGRLFVSATDKNQVYRVDLKELSAVPVKFDKEPSGPNGLIYSDVDHERYLLVAEWGGNDKPNGNIRCYAISESLDKGTQEETPADFPVKDGYMDGIAAICDGDGVPKNLLYTDWVDFSPGGKLQMLSVADQVALATLEIPNGPVAGPADFFFNPKTSAIVLPCMLDGRVLLLKLKQVEAAP